LFGFVRFGRCVNGRRYSAGEGETSSVYLY